MKKIGLLVVPLVAASFLTSCGEKEHFVTFDTIGGSHIATQRVKDGERAVKPEKPERGADHFERWFTDNETFEHEYTFTDPVTEDITLYAKWEKATYTITFKNDGDVDQKIENIQPDSFITEKIPTPTTKKPGYDFIGWCTDEKGENVFDFATVKINQDYTLYSGWKAVTKHTISFKGMGCKANGGSITEPTEAFQFVSEEKEVTLIIVPNTNFLLDGTTPTFLVDGKTAEPKKYEKYYNNYRLTFDVKGETLISIEAIKVDGTCRVSFNTDAFCSMMYGNTSIDAEGIDVVYSTENYIKFSIKASQETEKKPGNVTIKDGNGAIYTDYLFNKDNGDLFIKMSTPKLIISCVCDIYKSLDEMTWPQIQEISTKSVGLAFKIGDTKRVQLTQQDTNEDGADVISGDELYQTVRIIGFNHDNLADDSGKANITFEFVDTISDAYGHSLAALWHDTGTEYGLNSDYPNSIIRKNLTGNGGGEISWYERGSGAHSDAYADKTVYSMLPDKLKECLKTIKKNIWIYDGGIKTWTQTPVADTLFLPSLREMNTTNSLARQPASDESIYPYYEYVAQERAKTQIKKDDYYEHKITITDIIRTNACNRAGWCYRNKNGNSYYWTRTTSNYENTLVFTIDYNVNNKLYGTNEFACPVAPIFCV